MIKFKIALVILFTLVHFGGHSQDIHRLDLETTIQIAKRQSPTMMTLMRDLELAQNNLVATMAGYKPQVSLNVTLPQYSESIVKYEDSLGISFYPARQSNMGSSISVSQRLPTDGSISLSGNLSNTTNFYTSKRSAQFSSRIGISQPIAAFFGVNNFRMDLKQARLSHDRTMRNLKRRELDLVYNVSQTFYNLLSARENMKLADNNYARQKEAYEIAKNKYEAGLLREVEALQMEVDLVTATNNYENLKTSYLNMIRDFKETIGINPMDSIVLLNEMEYKPVRVDVEDAIARAMAHRNELIEREIQIEISQMNLKKIKAAVRISGSIGFGYNFHGAGQSTFDDPYFMAYNNTWTSLTERPGSFSVGVSGRIPLIDWGANKARVRSAETGLVQQEVDLETFKRNLSREIRSLVDKMNNSLRGLEIMEKSVVIAEKSFEISKKRYENDEIDSQAMSLERDRLDGAYKSYLSSYITYKLSLSDLMRTTFFDYEKGVEVLE